MAYNRVYQYETSPRKLEPEYEPVKTTYPKKSSTVKRTTRKEQAQNKKKLQRKLMFYIATCFTALFIISYRYSAIDDTYAELKEQKNKLALLEKENTQLEANIESTLNLTRVENDAKELLGMQKLSPEQTVYVTLPKIDHVETSSQEVKSTDLEENWLTKIINIIVQNFK